MKKLEQKVFYESKLDIENSVNSVDESKCGFIIAKHFFLFGQLQVMVVYRNH